MTEKFIDLHIHSYYSDGIFSPEVIIKYAKQKDLAAIALADHDTTRGVALTIEEGNKNGIEVVPAVEISADFPSSPEGEIHILGYFIDWQDAVFQEKLKYFRDKRTERARKILEKLADISIKLSPDDIFSENKQKDSSIGRLHFARLLVKEGFVYNVRQAFEKYLGPNKPAYVAKARMHPSEAIKIILDARGIPVLAHPYTAGDLPQTLKILSDYGLKGMEVWHTRHGSGTINKLMQLAKDFNLMPTGGSDCHGIMEGDELLFGKLKIPYSVLENLKNSIK